MLLQCINFCMLVPHILKRSFSFSLLNERFEHHFLVYRKYCSVMPRVICAGTVTRRAVESTWMTVSNPEEVRIGSELKGLIKAPLGYRFVGSDVDSQELWIAALFGDSRSLRIHGCTPNSWMLLKGDRNLKTDQHSVIAQEMSISRSQAKVLNYGRMYGAGRAFAVRLLKGFRPDLSSDEAERLATKLYRRTKGRNVYLYELSEVGLEALEEARKSFKEPFPTHHGRYVDEVVLNSLLSVNQSLTLENAVSSKSRLWFNGRYVNCAFIRTLNCVNALHLLTDSIMEII
ncbi:DNA-directed DNA polymerase [Trichuris suis]|nr:DNA-directed DNA polymerase [Trichuris suis]